MQTTKLLFTPGPLTTSETVKKAMLHDFGSRDAEFLRIVADIRRRLLALAGVATPEYEAVLLQGSGTFSVESVFSTAIPPAGKVLLAVNGAYGRRMLSICKTLGIDAESINFPEDQPVDAEAVRQRIESGTGWTHLATVHCETTTGIINPVEALGEIAAQRGLCFILDAMSSFGAIPFDMAGAKVHFLVSSANKCIQGVPGFGFVIAERDALLASRGNARSLSLDILAQWEGLEANGQFRFTPPTHVLAAFHQALLELDVEGGVVARHARYTRNHATLVAGMRALGFREFLPPDLQGPIITSFFCPVHPAWNFEVFYGKLSDRGFVIYPGKVSDADCFRIGNIGHLFEKDMLALLDAIKEVLGEMGVQP